jgi:ATP-dependent Clp protease ATP-binding subunit ClpA
MTTRLSIDARAEVLPAARAEALRRRDRFIGSEHLLLGLLADPLGRPTQLLGVNLTAARAALDRLDREALNAIGVNSTPAQPLTTNGPHRARLGLTSGARRVLVHAVHEAISRKASRITTDHLLLGVVAADPPDQAAVLLRFLDLDIDQIRRSLLSP